MRRKLLIGVALLVGFFVIGAEWYLLAQPLPQAENPIATQAARKSSTQSTATPIPDKAQVKPAATAATSTVGTPTATPSLITVNTPTVVTVTVQINPTPIPGGVNLLRLGPTGTQPTILGVMSGDGTNDGVYTLRVSFNEQKAGQVQLEVTAAFPGALLRAVSPVASLQVWPTVKDSTGMVQLSYPPTWNVATTGGVTTITSQTNPGPLTDQSLATFGTIEVETLKNANPTGLPITQWYSANAEGGFSSDPLSTATTTIDGQTAVIITTAELGLWTHIFAASGVNIFHVAYGPASTTLTPVYQESISTIAIQ